MYIHSTVYTHSTVYIHITVHTHSTVYTHITVHTRSIVCIHGTVYTNGILDTGPSMCHLPCQVNKGGVERCVYTEGSGSIPRYPSNWSPLNGQWYGRHSYLATDTTPPLSLRPFYHRVPALPLHFLTTPSKSDLNSRT